MDKKKLILWTLLDVVFFVVFNILFFVLGGFKQHASIWVSAIFLLVAFVFSIATHFLMKKTSNKKILGSPYYIVSSGYFRLECVIAAIFLIVRTGSFKVAMVAQLLLLALYSIVIILKMIFADGKKEETKEVTPTEK
jgi:hypothetical protein